VAVTNGRRGARQQQLERHRAPDDVRGPDDHGVFPLGLQTAPFQQLDHAIWRARAHRRELQGEAADVVRVKSIHVLGGIDRLDDRFLVDV